MNESNAVLAQRFLENDDDAFAVLFGRHYSRVFQVCLRLLGHRQDAEDITQETFSRAAKYLKSWDHRRPFEPWLLAIAGNRCRSFLAQRRNHLSLAPAAEPGIDSDQSGAVLLREEIDMALSRLSQNQRQAFELFHRHNLGYQEIANQMGRPVGTIKTWVHRARTEMIQHLSSREVFQTRQVPISRSRPRAVEVRR